MDIARADRKLTSATVRSVSGNICKCHGEKTVELTIKPGDATRLGDNLLVY